MIAACRSGFGADWDQRFEPSPMYSQPRPAFIPDTPGRKQYALKMGSSFQWGKFKSPPDLNAIVARPTVAHLIDNCLLLGFYPEKDPQVVTGREENMLRFVGLRVETAE
jgi:hypothetical protein